MHAAVWLFVFFSTEMTSLSGQRGHIWDVPCKDTWQVQNKDLTWIRGNENEAVNRRETVHFTLMSNSYRGFSLPVFIFFRPVNMRESTLFSLLCSLKAQKTFRGNRKVIILPVRNSPLGWQKSYGITLTAAEGVIPQAKGDISGSIPADICHKLSQVLNSRQVSEHTWGSGVVSSGFSWHSNV